MGVVRHEVGASVWLRWTTMGVVAFGTSEQCSDPTGRPVFEPIDPPSVIDSELDTLAADDDERLLVHPPLVPCPLTAPLPRRLRVASWNMSAGLYSSRQEIQVMLASIEPDVVLLQEVDVEVPRSFDEDQPQLLADALGHDYAFAATMSLDPGEYGLAVLSRLPFSSVERLILSSRGAAEPRIALDVTLCVGALPVRLVDVHADYQYSGHYNNLRSLADELGSIDGTGTIIGGDLNATTINQGVASFIETTEAYDVFDDWDPGPTINGARLDYVLLDPEWEVSKATRHETEASDHALLVVDLIPSLDPPDS